MNSPLMQVFYSQKVLFYDQQDLPLQKLESDEKFQRKCRPKVQSDEFLCFRIPEYYLGDLRKQYRAMIDLVLKVLGFMLMLVGVLAEDATLELQSIFQYEEKIKGTAISITGELAIIDTNNQISIYEWSNSTHAFYEINSFEYTLSTSSNNTDPCQLKLSNNSNYLMIDCPAQNPILYSLSSSSKPKSWILQYDLLLLSDDFGSIYGIDMKDNHNNGSMLPEYYVLQSEEMFQDNGNLTTSNISVLVGILPLQKIISIRGFRNLQYLAISSQQSINESMKSTYYCQIYKKSDSEAVISYQLIFAAQKQQNILYIFHKISTQELYVITDQNRILGNLKDGQFLYEYKIKNCQLLNAVQTKHGLIFISCSNYVLVYDEREFRLIESFKLDKEILFIGQNSQEDKIIIVHEEIIKIYQINFLYETFSSKIIFVVIGFLSGLILIAAVLGIIAYGKIKQKQCNLKKKKPKKSSKSSKNKQKQAKNVANIKQIKKKEPKTSKTPQIEIMNPEIVDNLDSNRNLSPGKMENKERNNDMKEEEK